MVAGAEVTKHSELRDQKKASTRAVHDHDDDDESDVMANLESQVNCLVVN